MSMQDPISDMLTRIRNAQIVGMKTVSIPLSKIKLAIANVLKDEGYIVDFMADTTVQYKPQLIIELKYYQNRPVIQEIKRVSRPGLRAYRNKNKLPVINNGLGVAIVSTSKGVMTARQAMQQGHGGEVLCYVV